MNLGVIHGFSNIEFLNFKVISDNEIVTFDAAFYFMMTTLITSGFGNIRPVTDLAKFVIMLFLIIMILVIAKQISEISNLLKVKYIILFV